MIINITMKIITNYVIIIYVDVIIVVIVNINRRWNVL